MDFCFDEDDAMAHEEVVQVALRISPECVEGLARGDYIRTGGIIRDATGQIVAHLPEVRVSGAGDALNTAREFANSKKPIALTVGGVSLALLVVGAGGRKYLSNRRKKRLRRADQHLQLAIEAYFNAIEEQKMRLEIVDGPGDALREMRALWGRPSAELIAPELLEALITCNREFIGRNAPALLESGAPEQSESLEDLLVIHKRILGDEA